jgi:type I restriction enzyme S subunit
VPVIRGGDIRDNRIVFSEEKRVSAEVSNQFKRTILRGAEIVLNLIAEPGHSAVVPPSMAGYNVSRDVAVIPLIDQMNRSFVSHFLRSPIAIDWLSARLQGSVTQKINLGTLRQVPVPMPPGAYQDAVAAVLDALDDKIAVNDQIAAASDHLVASTLGQILAEDDQRSFVPLSEVALVNQRKVTPIPAGFLRYIDISSVSLGNVVWPLRTPWSDAPSRARRGVLPGDTIWSTVRPGRRSYALILADDPEIVVSTGFAVLTPFKVGPAFLYEITKRDDFVQYLENVAEGSAYPAVRADRFERATVPLLSPARLRKFEEFAMPLRRRVNGAQTESRILAELRDTLLPKLMSGEIRVREAERIVEDAT